MRLGARSGMPAFDAGAFAGWSLAAAALMIASALSYRAYCGAQRGRHQREEAGLEGAGGGGSAGRGAG